MRVKKVHVELQCAFCIIDSSPYLLMQHGMVGPLNADLVTGPPSARKPKAVKGVLD